RRNRLCKRRRRPHPAVDRGFVPDAGHRRLRAKRHAREPAPVLRGGPAFDRGRGARRPRRRARARGVAKIPTRHGKPTPMDAMKLAVVAALLAACAAQPEAPAPLVAKTSAKILEDSPASDWRRLDPENTLYMDLPSGRVVIELAPLWAPRSVANIKTLTREKYFDGLAVIRVQDNFVAQWGDPTEKKSLGSARKTIPPEFTRPITADLPFVPLPDRDIYAPQTGYSGGFPAARDSANNRAWL